jgi:hypothetical protein
LSAEKSLDKHRRHSEADAEDTAGPQDCSEEAAQARQDQSLNAALEALNVGLERGGGFCKAGSDQHEDEFCLGNG